MRILIALLAAAVALAAEDSAEGAGELFKAWTRAADSTAKLRKEWSGLRSDRQRTEAKVFTTKNASKRAGLVDKLKKIDAELGAVDERLGVAEREAAKTLQAIGKLKSAEAMAWFASTGLKKAKDPLVRRAMARAVARSKAAGPDALLAALGASKKAEMIVPLLQALGKHAASERALPILTRYLTHRDWTVRVAAAFALARSARPEGIEPVLIAFKTTAPKSRERSELAAALTRYTGENHGPFPDIWWKWWQAEKLNVLAGRVPLGKGARHAKSTGSQGSFYGIPQEEARIIYVVDVSGSMDVSMSNPRWIDGNAVPAADDEDSRFDAALRELLRAIRKLGPKTTFSVVLYSSHVKTLADSMLPATPANRARIEKELAHTGPGGSTNIYAALDRAMRLAGVHPEEKSAKQVADAIYLLSDGSPTNAKGKSEDPERILLAARAWNALGKVAIHTIGIGKQHNRGFLEALATQNGGRYYAVGRKAK
ncbi:MAG: vWA domain-containing protein [Planctomycetota bacterium]|jgi:hypothetical protein